MVRRLEAMGAGELKIVGPQAGMLRYAREHTWTEFLIIVERKYVIGPPWAQ